MSEARAAKQGKELSAAYKPNPAECATMEAFLLRQKQKPPAPRMKVTVKGATAQLAADHPMPSLGQALLMQALGTMDLAFFDGLLRQLVNAGSPGRQPDEDGVNFMLSAIRGIGPTDEVESMLAAQMAAVHMATMTLARRLAQVDNIPQQDSAERAFNKLARTFAIQVEALKRYRSGGEQRVTVQHVTVNEGGQAIVGHVAPGLGGGGAEEKREATP